MLYKNQKRDLRNRFYECYSEFLTSKYEFTRENSQRVVIQEHSAGHKFGAPGGIGDQEAHFNLRPIGNTRHGKLKDAKDHYNFRGEK
ncbi:HNH/endonuclease VII fold putative polymorphic toxin [Pseudomonas haemolytica]|uniref:Type IV secretion protein Rhs n=1 Tax=Pseudomonas haemolytica TaxID=2600065 RepID=A0A5P1D7E7_9PSED|nr:HNH/endonuclease VII fold putative polymorphic toxin [Pseudomonas haemolytica]MBJ2247558.1 type IV secretion protein Rhs [Pseudomonas haemolytica]MBJ2272316.1 type IV secretion protein Rhs [Pseudomonas haemolytica]MBK3449958.1 type IV secretion protein Rhs [Pseudomonas haemolytica]MBK3461542.1 type IV secretion protein Rhs [Pseudomonas haemolytica]MRJ19854.1 type IV secretion protein Rhs [Pseudomonas haemolytica]